MTVAAFRRARPDDLPSIIALLADDELGAAREITTDPPHPRYVSAFEAIASDPNQILLVAEFEGAIAGCLQVSIIPGLSRAGMTRGQIESVRIARSRRGSGLGRDMISHAVDICRGRGCELVQLTTDATRKDAHRFYESLGFTPSHIGMKLGL